MSVRIPPGAPSWAQALVRQLRQILTELQNPRIIADVDGLGPAQGREGQRFYVRDIDGAGTPGIAYADNAGNWRRVDTNATL